MVDDGVVVAVEAVVSSHLTSHQQQGIGRAGAGAKEVFHLMGGPVPCVHSDGDEFLAPTVILPDLLDIRGLRDTVTSVETEEVDEDDLAVEVAERDRSTIRQFQGKVRGLLTQLRGCSTRGCRQSYRTGSRNGHRPVVHGMPPSIGHEPASISWFM